MSITALQSIKKPWAHLLVHAEGEALDKLLSVPAQFVTKTVSGKKCKTKAGLLDEFARVFSFPDYFGHNWDAFEDMINDLSWAAAPGYVLLYDHAAPFALAAPGDFLTALDILRTASGRWRTDGTPFYALVRGSDIDAPSLTA